MITTPEGLVYQGEAQQVVVPAHDGEMGILPQHAPLIGEMGVGELRVQPAAGGATPALSFLVDGGFLQVLQDRVVVLATRAEAAEKIDAAAAEAELKSLQEEETPQGMTMEAREARARKIRTARAKVKIAEKSKG